MAEEEDVDEFADLEVGGCDVLDDVGEEVGDVSALGDELLPGGGGRGVLDSDSVCLGLDVLIIDALAYRDEGLEGI